MDPYGHRYGGAVGISHRLPHDAPHRMGACLVSEGVAMSYRRPHPRAHGWRLSYRMHTASPLHRLRRMRTLACLLKQPSETFQAYNARLLDACRVLRPTAARMVVVTDQPKVDLLATDEESPVVRVAVCPLDADDDGEAKRTEARLRTVLDAAEGLPVFTVDGDPPVATMFLWPLDGDDESEPGDDGDDQADDPPAPAGAAAPPADDPPDDDDGAVDHGGRVPFGLRKRGGRYQEHPQEAPVVRTILRAAAEGQTADLIERALVAEHGPWVRAQWAPKEVPRHIRRILAKADFYRDHLPGVA